MKNIFLTGDIQVGKSTILNSFLLNFKGSIGGFKTEPIFLDKGKTFILKSLNHFNGKIEGNHYICKFSDAAGRLLPQVETFEGLGVSILKECLEKNPDVIIMDELGIFESHALNFQKKYMNVYLTQYRF